VYLDQGLSWARLWIEGELGVFVDGEVERRELRDMVRERTDSGESGSLERSCRDQVCLVFFAGVVDTFDVEHNLCSNCESWVRALCRHLCLSSLQSTIFLTNFKQSFFSYVILS
jgi:hypothetical protein